MSGKARLSSRCGIDSQSAEKPSKCSEREAGTRKRARNVIECAPAKPRTAIGEFEHDPLPDRCPMSNIRYILMESLFDMRWMTGGPALNSQTERAVQRQDVFGVAVGRR